MVNSGQWTVVRLRTFSAWLLLSLGFALALVACGADSNDQDATAEALGQAVIQTATAQAARGRHASGRGHRGVVRAGGYGHGRGAHRG